MTQIALWHTHIAPLLRHFIARFYTWMRAQAGGRATPCRDVALTLRLLRGAPGARGAARFQLTGEHDFVPLRSSLPLPASKQSHVATVNSILDRPENAPPTGVRVSAM